MLIITIIIMPNCNNITHVMIILIMLIIELTSIIIITITIIIIIVIIDNRASCYMASLLLVCGSPQRLSACLCTVAPARGHNHEWRLVPLGGKNKNIVTRFWNTNRRIHSFACCVGSAVITITITVVIASTIIIVIVMIIIVIMLIITIIIMPNCNNITHVMIILIMLIIELTSIIIITINIIIIIVIIDNRVPCYMASVRPWLGCPQRQSAVQRHCELQSFWNDHE
jgi:hypothetical protein